MFSRIKVKTSIPSILGFMFSISKQEFNTIKLMILLMRAKPNYKAYFQKNLDGSYNISAEEIETTNTQDPSVEVEVFERVGE